MTELSRTGVQPALAELRISFTLRFEDLAQQAAGNGERLYHLMPGTEYNAKVRVTRDTQQGASASAVLLEQSLVLWLTCEDLPEMRAVSRLAADDPTRVNDHAVLIRRGEIEQGCEYDFSIRVPEVAHCPGGRVHLNVSWSHSPTSNATKSITIPVMLCGNGPVPIIPLCKVAIDLDRKASPNVAILHVFPHPETPDILLQLHGWIGSVHDLQAASIRRPSPRLDIPRRIKANERALSILSSLRVYSEKDTQELNRWVLRLATSEDVILMIHDQSDDEIPWEMLSPDQKNHLGSLLEVSRWLDRGGPAFSNGLMEDITEGQLIYYLPSQPTEGEPGSEGEIPSGLAGEHLGKASDLLFRLSQDLSNIGMVYLACHGKYVYPTSGETPYQELYGLDSANDLVNDLDLYMLDRRDERVPIFFVNACDSARLRIFRNALYGLPDIFLGRVACGYIGTLGPVSDSMASKIGYDILQRLLLPGGGRPSAILRDLRREALAASKGGSLFLPGESDTPALRLLSTLMYVYYGNQPRRLLLRPLVREAS
jgi:hypothetical protein